MLLAWLLCFKIAALWLLSEPYRQQTLPLNHSLAHSLNDSPTHSLAHSLTHPSIHSFMHAGLACIMMCLLAHMLSVTIKVDMHAHTLQLLYISSWHHFFKGCLELLLRLQKTAQFKATSLPGKKTYYRTDESPDVWFEPTEVWEIRGADLTVSPVHKAAVGHIHPDRGISLRSALVSVFYSQGLQACCEGCLWVQRLPV